MHGANVLVQFSWSVMTVVAVKDNVLRSGEGKAIISALREEARLVGWT